MRKGEGSSITTDRPIFVLGSFVLSCSAKVSRFPREGESVAAEIVTVEPGGKGFNLAVAARRLGHAVDGVLAVGDDLQAAFAVQAVARAGLPESMLLHLRGRSGSGVGFTDARGETLIAVDAGVNGTVTDGHVRAAASRLTASVMVMAQFEIGDAPIREAFAQARQAGIPTLLNPSPFRDVAPDILGTTDILVMNQTETEALARSLALQGDDLGHPEGFAARLGPALLAKGPALVVLTRGAQGALALTAEGLVMQPALRVVPVDALGAGDAFAAALGVGLVEGIGLSEAMKLAAAAGALTTTKIGAFDALPQREAIAALLSDA